jgi:putative peptide zinc metalloprotease protein
MAVLPGPATAGADTVGSAPAAPEILRRADGVQLMGEMAGSGYRRPPALARRSDGQTIQLTPLLYLVLEATDGTRTLDEVAAHVSERCGRAVTADNVRTLADRQLRPAGLLTAPDGAQPEVRRADPLLGLRLRYAVTERERTRRLTAPFTRLFHPLLVVAVLAAFLVVCWWVLIEKGLASATHQAFDQPSLLLLVFVVTVLSAGFHEFGHAAAACRGGATPGAMGAGIYLVWPAFYTDVTDSYRLGRGGRVRTDLGGLYFNAIVAVAITAIWWVTRYDALLLVVATQILQMIRQLTPLVRFDGYHVLADVTGVPDLFQRIRPTLLGLLPWRWRHPESTVLKPWARAVVSVWVVVVVPVLAFTVYLMVIALPRILGTAWAGLGKQGELLGRAWSAGDPAAVAVRVLAMVAIAFPILAIALVLARLVRRIVVSAWRRTEGRPLGRALAALVAAGVLVGVAWAWWPHPGAYRPVQPDEGWTLPQAVSTVVSTSPSGRAESGAEPGTQPAGLVEGQHGRIVTGWTDGEARPTREQPRLALVLVPRGYDTTESARPDTTGPAGLDAPAVGAAGAEPASYPWVFPFDKPLAPGEGDNQALAVTTTDGATVYDVAFALVWVEGDVPALNRNEAYAFASCTNCTAVAVGFQVVLVVGDNHVAAPQNISAAVNYDCVNCLTYALAMQLFVTVPGPLSDAAMAELDELWAEIAEFGENIEDVPVTEIRARLTGYEQQILQVIEEDQAPLAPGPSSPTEAVHPGPEASPGGAAGEQAPADPDGMTADQPAPAETQTPAEATADPSAGGAADPSAGSAADPSAGSAAEPNPDSTPAPSPAAEKTAAPTTTPAP